jgi:hypothetical protein
MLATNAFTQMASEWPMQYGSIGVERNPSRRPWWGRRPVSSWLVVLVLVLVLVLAVAADRVLAVIAAELEHRLRDNPGDQRRWCLGSGPAGRCAECTS